MEKSVWKFVIAMVQTLQVGLREGLLHAHCIYYTILQVIQVFFNGGPRTLNESIQNGRPARMALAASLWASLRRYLAYISA